MITMTFTTLAMAMTVLPAFAPRVRATWLAAETVTFTTLAMARIVVPAFTSRVGATPMTVAVVGLT